MNWFGRKSGRDASRPALTRAHAGAGVLGEWPQSYEAQVREGYCANPVAQRAVKIIAEGVADAPIEASDPALRALVVARTQGQELIAALAAQLLLHGNAFIQLLGDGAGGVAELFALRPERVGAGRWRLTRLWRGRRGTEAAIGTAAAGGRFVLVEAAALAVHDAVAGIGAGVSVLGTGTGDGEGVEAHAPVTGASVVPPAPVHLRAERAAAGGALIRWTRRSRIGWRWRDAADAPLGEELERYQVRIVPAAGPATLETVTASELYLPPETLAARPVAIEVRQAGDHGLSPPALLTL
ncbi:phage tail baseplate protein [Sphingomonas sp. MS122]|uniref:GTA baseplate fiber-binding domain-containing protein n=1 Tax=Sphingomonas sp. MS122 TaxID=3412683 RepID=UPI003C2FB67E